MAWSKAFDFYAFSWGAPRKPARNVAETAQRKSQVRDPIITARRLAVGLTSVYTALPCYTSFAQHGQAARKAHDDHGDDVIDVESREVIAPQEPQALPSPTDDAEVETSLWKRWHQMGRGRKPRQEK